MSVKLNIERTALNMYYDNSQESIKHKPEIRQQKQANKKPQYKKHTS